MKTGRAGAMDRKVEVQQRRSPVERDEHGAPKQEWVPALSVWCAVERTAEQEAPAGKTVVAVEGAVFTCWAFESWRPTPWRDRLWFEDGPWDVKGAKMIGQNKLWEITATRRAPGG
jgi:hypothetical protein